MNKAGKKMEWRKSNLDISSTFRTELEEKKSSTLLHTHRHDVAKAKKNESTETTEYTQNRNELKSLLNPMVDKINWICPEGIAFAHTQIVHTVCVCLCVLCAPTSRFISACNFPFFLSLVCTIGDAASTECLNAAQRLWCRRFVFRLALLFPTFNKIYYFTEELVKLRFSLRTFFLFSMKSISIGKHFDSPIFDLNKRDAVTLA